MATMGSARRESTVTQRRKQRRKAAQLGRTAPQLVDAPPPTYAINTEEALKRAGCYPKERREKPGCKLSAQERMRNAIAGAASDLRRKWKLTYWWDPDAKSFKYDPEEIDRKKAERWKAFRHRG